LIFGRVLVDVIPFPVIVFLSVIEALLDPELESPDLGASRVEANKVSEAGQLSETGNLIIERVHMLTVGSFSPVERDRQT
jgi:hypothetical protein